MNRPTRRDIRSRVPDDVAAEYSHCRLFLTACTFANIVGCCALFHIPFHAWAIPGLVFQLIIGMTFYDARKTFKIYWENAKKDAWVDYDAKVIEDAANKIEAIAFREMVRDPAVLRQLLSAFDHIEVGIENVTVQYRGRDVKLRACRLWRDGDTLRIGR